MESSAGGHSAGGSFAGGHSAGGSFAGGHSVEISSPVSRKTCEVASHWSYCNVY